MSFPRAKIKRFNEVSVTSPSPAKYNVDLKEKSKCGFIPQSDRFTGSKSPTFSETESTQSTPCFRTPTLVKKKKMLTITSKLQNCSLTHNELLKEKVVECNNKDIFIQELMDQLEELKRKIFNLNCEAEMLEKDKKNFERNISDLRTCHTSEIDCLKKEHKIRISTFNEKILEIEKFVDCLKSENEKLKKNIETLQENHKTDCDLHSKEIEMKDKLIEDKELALKQIEKDKESAVQKHQVELEELTAKHQKEMENLEFDMLKCVAEAHKSLDEEKRLHEQKVEELKKNFLKEIEDLKQSFDIEKETLNKENIAHIKHIEENMTEMRILSEIQASEKYEELQNYWKGMLEKQQQESAAILKECQAISEYAIMESEIEKNGYKSKLEEKVLKYNDLEKKYDDIYFHYKKLQASYSNIQNKLYRLIKETREKDAIVNQVNKLLNEKQTFEITVLRSQQTIDILKRRLQESDQDVEQLKNEISHNEKQILEYEQKLNLQLSELKNTHTLIEELEIHNESIMKTTQEEIDRVKRELLKKVKELKTKMDESQKEYTDKLAAKEKEKTEFFKMLKEQQILNDNASKLLYQANLELERLTSENSEYCDEIVSLNDRNNTLQGTLDKILAEQKSWVIERKELDLKVDILKNEIHQLRKHEKICSDASVKMDEMKKTILKSEEELQRKCTKISELENEIQAMSKKCDCLEKSKKEYMEKIEEQKALIAPFKDQLESYELEMKNLKSAKTHMENEAKDLGMKYANILGHQNHKQKIKYMVNLKTKTEDLQKVNLDLEAKMKIQEKKMEKMRKENAELKRTLKKSIFEDKENIGSPNRSLKCESPGPLREIN